MSLPRVCFLTTMIAKYKEDQDIPAQVFVDLFRDHYKGMYDRDIKKGVKRKMTYLSSVQTGLSRFRERLVQEFQTSPPSPEFLKGLRLTLEENRTLKEAKLQVVHQKAIDLAELDGDAIIQDCREMLKKKNPYLKVIALACLTGRRMAEIIFTMTFSAPKEKHHTDSKYWVLVQGVCKQRKGDPNAVKEREIPLLERRDYIVDSIAKVRRDLRVTSVAEVNRKFGKPVQRHMQKYCPHIGKLHDFRKFYVLACFHYFNERNCSLPRLASDYLGHKTMSQTVLTYLNFRLKPLGKLNFTKKKKIPET